MQQPAAIPGMTDIIISAAAENTLPITIVHRRKVPAAAQTEAFRFVLTVSAASGTPHRNVPKRENIGT